MLWTPFIGQMIGCLVTIISIYIIYRFASVEDKDKIYNNEKSEIIKTRPPELSPLVDGNHKSNIHK
jgi:hypothetical protein